MKYKVGDKVKIKTWEVMKTEYGETQITSIYKHIKDENKVHFIPEMEDILNKRFTDRIVEIQIVDYEDSTFSCPVYRMQGINYGWKDYMIEGLVKEHIESEPIHSRFEILDIRD